MGSGYGSFLADQLSRDPRPRSDPRVVAALNWLSPALGLGVILMGCTVLVGWALDISLLKSVLPGLATMKANTALGFVLSGASLLLSRRRSGDRRTRLLARACALAVVLLALVTLGEYVMGGDAGIDQLLFQDTRSAVTAHPGRMSPLTALCFAACGAALLLANVRRTVWFSHLLALVAAALAGLALVGYLYSVRALYGIASYTEMALHTAWGFELLAFALLSLDPEGGMTALVASDSTGGTTARRLLPAVVVAPILVGWLRLQGQRAGLYSTEMGLAIVVITMILVLSAFVWQNARSLLHLDDTRRNAEDALRGREAHMRGVLDSALDAVVSMNAAGVVTFWSRRAEDIFGWTRDEAVGRELAELIIPERSRDSHRQGFARYAQTQEGRLLGRRVEMTAIRRDGKEFPVEVSIAAVREGDSYSFNGFVADLTRQRRTEAALQRSEERYRLFFEEDLAGAFITKPDGAILDCNPAFVRMFGFNSAEEAIGTNAGSLYPTAELRESMLERLRRDGKIEALDVELRRADGTPVSVIENVVGTFDERGELVEIKGYVLDNTERKKVEAQLRQAQRIDAIGRLAGGVAHDFNNLLGVITGFDELLLRQLPPGDPRIKYASEIGKAAERAAALTRQLLAFSRKQLLQPQVLDLNVVVLDMEKLLHRLIGEDIELVARTLPALRRVKADPGQMEQVIMNLAVNARDAMPQGGRLTIETGNVVLDAEYVRQHTGAQVGHHVMLAVSDTGHGMDAATQARVFEPFFTTKEKGKGTGLGLATVYGIVKQSGGSIWVYSEPGHGATFKVYLPAVDEPVRVRGSEPVEAAVPQGSETVLVVEDEEVLREIVREALQASGYKVLEARHGAEALRICESHAPLIDLVLTDAVMPGIGGRELGERITSIRPEVKMLYMSGYTDDAIVRHGVLTAEVAFLQKPFTLDALARKVRAVLDAKDSSRQPT
jgi:two-component system, cell cycle sensor histidine kinase and response regulator CckA